MSNNRIILLLFCIFFCLRLLFILFPFWGLEYEDSYIYTDTARFLHYNYDFKSMPFKCQSCVDGSYLNCFEYGSYGGHFLFVPYILSFFNILFGYNYINIFVLNLLFSIFAIVIVYAFVLAYKLEISLPVFLFFAVVTPFISIFNTSGLAETISSFFVLIFFFSVYILSTKNFSLSSIHFWLSILFILMAVSIKRENLVLLIFLYSIPLLKLYYNKYLFNWNYVVFIVIVTFLLGILIYYLKLNEIESNEGHDIGNNTFSIKFFLLNIKQLFYAVTDYNFWGITGFFFISCIVSLFITRRIDLFSSMALVVICLYILIYSYHYRSYYQQVYSFSSPFDTLRYSVNYFPILLLFISNYIYTTSRFLNVNLQSSFYYKISFVLIVFFTIVTINIRKDLFEDEYYSRIKPVTDVLHLAKKEDVIISPIPIVFRCYADESQKLIDLYNCDSSKISLLRRFYSGSNIFILTPKKDVYEFKRYGFKLNRTHMKVCDFNSSNYELLILESEAN